DQRDRSAHFGCHHQGTLDLRARPSAAERGAWARPLRRAILARTSPPCAHDDARLRLPLIPSPQTSEAGKKESTDRRLDQACRPSVTPSWRSSPDRHRSDAHTAENGSARARSVNKSAKVVVVVSFASTSPSKIIRISSSYPSRSGIFGRQPKFVSLATSKSFCGAPSGRDGSKTSSPG